MDNRTSRLIVEPIKQPGVFAFFSRLKLICERDGSTPRWVIEGGCFRNGAQIAALELRDDHIILPSLSTTGMPSPAIGSRYPQFPESGHARFRTSFDAVIAQQHPWLRLHAQFSGGVGLQIALIHLIENDSTSVSEPFISTAFYEKSRFKFYVANASDEIQGRYHANGLFYEIELLEYIRHTCPRGQIVADVGANVGNHAVYFDKVLEASEVVVFEPNEVARAILKKNIALNDCKNVNTRYVQNGVSDTPARYRIGEMPTNNLGGTSLVEDSNGSITTVRLDDVLGCLRVGLIKIDVEGMEMSALRSASRLIATSSPVIAIEVTPESSSEVGAFLDGCGYRIERTFSMYVNFATLIAVSVGIFPQR